jgi:23S rRNA pseudouridine2457 synthase
MHRYFIIYKPFQVLSQFSTEGDKKTLKDYFKVPNDVYPVGRLDYDSEGLLILTNDRTLNHRLLDPKYKHEREYWVQVEGDITKEAIGNLQQGVIISIDGKQHTTLPAKAIKFINEPVVYERDPPIRFRKNIPVSWISLCLHEGKNRQVRRMTAKVGFPTLRLIRHRIEKVTLGSLSPGAMEELPKKNIYRHLFNQ